MGRQKDVDSIFGDHLTPLLRQKFLHFVNVSLKYKYLYCSTPKVACSSILLTLQRAEAEDHIFTPEPWAEIHDRYFSPLVNPQQVPLFAQKVRNDFFYKFCFVRNPYDRIISCYLDKVVNSDYLSNRLFNSIGKSGADVTFQEFVDFVRNEPKELHDEHYSEQYSHNFVDFIEYDYVGKFENFSVDIEIICKHIGIDLNKYGGRLDLHKTESNHTSSLYDNSTKLMVRQIYERDFDKFGYKD